MILNPETAIKWVSQELLKFVSSSFGSSSLAQSSIHHKNIASSSGYIFLITLSKFSLREIKYSSILFISFFDNFSYFVA